MQTQKIKANIISLGCSKNLVDAECMSRILLDEKIDLVPTPDEAGVVIVNTCGFIESAKREAIDVILEIAEKKKAGICEFLIVTGCLAQRYEKDIISDLPEVDAILGTSSYQEIGRTVLSLYGQNTQEAEPKSPLGHMRLNRLVSTDGYAWLKIAEGCSRRCAFCAIPMIRGQYISRPVEDIVEEAENLAAQGFGEIILTAQDTTFYGMDLYKKRMLPELIRKLSRIDGIRLLRIMYTYSDGITEDLISEMKSNPKVAKYLDMPIQHGDNRILKAMNRHDTAESIFTVVERLRKEMPDIVIRTTVLVGFPGETQEAFLRLKELVEKISFDRMGGFVFSPEEGTPAEKMPDPVPQETAQQRLDEVMVLQKQITEKRNMSRIGQITDVLIESVSEDGIFYIGRSYGEAPEVDSSVYVLAPHKALDIGEVIPVRIVNAEHYELIGEALS